MESGGKIPTMIKIKQEVEEVPEASGGTEGYQVFFIKQEVKEEEDSGQDDEVEMQITTGSSSESVGDVSFKNSDEDQGWRLSGDEKEREEMKEQNEREVGNPSFHISNLDSNWQLPGEDKEKNVMRGPTSASFAPQRPLKKTRKLQVNTKQKEVCLAKNLDFQDNRNHRHQAKYRRVKNLFKKGHELAEITLCQVFLYVKDEFSKTTYWGTSDALELFKPVMDSVIMKGDKRVKSVKFVAPSKPDERCPQGTLDGPDLEGWLESDVPNAQMRTTLDKAKQKKLCLSKNMEFKDIGFLRHQARYRRSKNLFKKSHELAELTKCQVFLYVKDEFSKTTYWGTSDAMEMLFQTTIDSLIAKGEKAVQCVNFVIPSKAPEVMWSTSPTDGEALECDDPCSESVQSSQESVLSSTNGSSMESSSQLPKTTGNSTPKSAPEAQHHTAPNSILVDHHHSAPNSPLMAKHQSAPKSTLETPHASAPKSTLKTLVPINSPRNLTPESALPLSSCMISSESSPQELEPSVAGSPLCNTKASLSVVKTTSKQMCLAKNLEFKDNKNLRNQAKYRRVKNLFKKGHELAEITKCQVFLYVKDEFSKTTYWGTSDSLQLFQPTIDSLVMKGDKPAQNVKFVSHSEACEELEPSISRRPLLNTKTGMFEVNSKSKKVCLAKNLEFKDNNKLRHQAKYRRVKNLFKKGHELAELTNCQVLLYVKDEFSKTTYWGTSDALELFQTTIDSLVLKEGKPVQCVNFVTLPEASEGTLSSSTNHTSSEDCNAPSSGHLESVPSLQDSVPSSTIESPQGSFQHSTSTSDSAKEVTQVTSQHGARRSSLKTTPERSTPYSLRKRTTPTCMLIRQDLVSIIPDV